MPVTKEQWEQIELQLSGSFGRVELTCDGYKIDAVVARVAPLKYGIQVYVDGYVKGIWMLNAENSEIPVKFHCEKKRFIGSAKLREHFLKLSRSKLFSKEERTEYARKATATLSHWLPYWTSAKAFCRHIRKTCQSIEVVKIGY